MSQQGLRQASVREVTGTAFDYNGDFHALFDLAEIPSGDFNGRMLQWLNLWLSASYDNLPGAMAAFSAAQGASSFSSVGTFYASQGIGAVGQFMIAGGIDFDARFLSRLFQDAAGTTPVVSAGDPIGLWIDRALPANNGVQSSDALRPTLGVTGDRRTVDGNVAASANLLTDYLFNGTDDTIIFDVDVPATIATNSLVAGANSAAGTARMFVGFNALGNLVAGVGTDVLSTVKDAVDWRGQRCIAALVAAGGRTKLYTSNGTPYDEVKNGSAVTDVAVRIAAQNANGTAGSFFGGKIHRLLVAPRDLTSTEFTAIRAELLAS